MKPLIVYSTLAALILLSAPERSHGQDASQNLFPDKMVTEKKLAVEQIDVTQRIVSKGNYFALVAPDPFGAQNVGDNSLQFFNVSGDLLWRSAGLPYIKRISIEANSGRSLVAYNYTSDIGRNAYFSSDGAVLWDIPVQDPGITIGPNGHYGIIRTTGGEDDGGKFRIFDMASGLQLENNPLASIDYQYFRAAFIDENRVAIFYQNVILRPIKEAQLRAMKLRNEGKLSRLRGVGEIVTDAENPNYVDVTTFPVHYLLYSIANEEVITHVELVSQVGGPYYLTGLRKINIAIAEDLETVMLELGNASISRDASQIVALRIDGSLLWESADLPKATIGRLSILKSGDILVDSRPALGHPTQGFVLLSGHQGNIKWRSDIEKIESDNSTSEWIDEVFEFDGELIIQVNDGKYPNKLYFVSEIDGSQRYFGETEEYLLKTSRASGEIVTYDRTQKLIKTYK